MSDAFTKIAVADDGGVRTITLSVPERRNAIGPVMIGELLAALAEAEAAKARVVVLTGAGKAFCAGGDFGQIDQGMDPAASARTGEYDELLLAMLRSPIPIVARVNGHAMGGGLGLVAASTFAIGDANALLGTPEIDVGLFPMMIMAVLARLVPRRRLVEMMLLGQKLSAEEARALGILNAVAPTEGLDAEVKKVTDGLLSKSPSTIALGLRAFAEQDDLALAESLPLLKKRLAECLATEDAREGLTAFLEKRAPVWRGR